MDLLRVWHVDSWREVFVIFVGFSLLTAACVPTNEGITPSITAGNLDPSPQPALTTTVTRQPTARAQVTASPTMTSTATHTPTRTPPLPSATPSPTNTASPTVVPTLSEADWAELPSLAESALVKEEVFSELSLFEDAFIDWEDVTDSIKRQCPLDCGRIILNTSSRDMTQLSILLTRTASLEEAHLLVENLFAETLAEAEDSHIYSQDEIRRLRDAPPNTWIVDKTLDEIVIGTNHGPVVLLLHNSYDFCTTLDDGTIWCEGDVWHVAVTALDLAILQLAKLEAGGYPP